MRTFYFFSFLVLIFLLTFSSVLAIGISPPKNYVDYAEGETVTFDFLISNRASFPTTIQMSLDGVFSDDDVVFSEDIFTIPASSTHIVTATLTFPPYDTLTAFNKQRILIQAREVVVDKTIGGFAALTGVEGWILVQIPVPGQFGEITSFGLENVVEGLDSTISLDIINRGTADLRNTRATVDIFDFYGNNVSSVKFQNIVIASGDSTSLSHSLSSSSYNSGKYTAKAKYFYNSENAPMPAQTTFFIGSTDVMVTEYTQDLYEGQINSVKIHLQSLWGSPLHNIRGELTDFSGKTILLPVIDLDPFEEKVVDLYLDVPLLNSSAFRIDSSVYNSTSQDLSLKLAFPVQSSNDVEKVISLPFTVNKKLVPPVIETPLSISTSTLVILIGFVVFVLLALNMFFLVGKKKSPRKKKR